MNASEKIKQLASGYEQQVVCDYGGELDQISAVDVKVAYLEGARAMAELLAVREGEHLPRLWIPAEAFKPGYMGQGYLVRLATEENEFLGSGGGWVQVAPISELQSAIARFEADMSMHRERHKELAEMYHVERSGLEEARKMIFAERARFAKLAAAVQSAINNWETDLRCRTCKEINEHCFRPLDEALKEAGGV